MDSVVSAPVASGDFAADAAHFSAYWLDAKERLARLPAKPKRDRRRLRGRRGAQAGRARRPLRLPAPPCPHALRPVDRRAARSSCASSGWPTTRPRWCRASCRPRRGRGRGRAAPGRQGRLRDRPGHPVQPVPGRSRVRPASLPRHAAAARGIGRGAGQVPARRQARSRLRQGRAPGQGGRAAAGQQALPQLRGQFDPARHRDRAPTSASSTRRARSRCCAARSCPRASMPAGASSTPASTSRTSTTARSRSCGS